MQATLEMRVKFEQLLSCLVHKFQDGAVYIFCEMVRWHSVTVVNPGFT